MDLNLEIRFYDNEESNWENDMSLFDHQIEFIHVNEVEPNVLIADVSLAELGTETKKTKIDMLKNKIYINAYINHFVNEGNSYALYLQQLINIDPNAASQILKQQSSCGISYPNNGLNIDELLVWLKSSSLNKAILTDWDRTITVCEGMQFGAEDGLLPSKVIDGTIKIEDLLVYIMGGQERLEKVKGMLKQIFDNNIPFYILTHNRNASVNMFPKNRKIYIMILQQLMPYKTEEEIEQLLFSSGDYITMKSIKEGDRKNSYRKYKSACSINLVKNILRQCSAYYGGKKRRIKKSYKRIKKSSRRTRKRISKK